MDIFYWDQLFSEYAMLSCGRQTAAVSYFSTGTALTIGGFDGPHLGHSALFEKVFCFAKSESAISGRIKTGVVTFSRSPGALKNPHVYAGDISSLKMRLEYFASAGFDFVILIDFSSDFSKMKGKNFLDFLRTFCFMRFLAVGADFRCGYNLDTGTAELTDYAEKNDIALAVCPDVAYKGTRISSSEIRAAVKNGEMHHAECMLGRPYALDVSSVRWTVCRCASGSFASADGHIAQLLPQCGVYEVDVHAESADVLKTRLHAEASSFCLEIPQERNELLFREIVFKTRIS